MPDDLDIAMALLAEEWDDARYRAEEDLPPESAVSVGMDDMPLPPPEAYAADASNVVALHGPRGPAATVITPASPRTSQFFAASELADKPIPQRLWLVEDLIPQKTVTLFGGDGGTGKSLVALQLAVAAASRTAWLNRRIASGRVIFISAEDDRDELHRRLDAIVRNAGIGFADLADLTLRSLAGEDALLAVESHVQLVHSALFEELDARADIDEPVLIVIDTLADVFPSNENDRAKVRQFIGILRSLALKRQCAVVLLAHPSLSGLNSGAGTSGSTAWNNSVRSRLYLSRIVQDGNEPDPDRRILSTKKANYGRIGGEISLLWKDGVFVEDRTPDSLDCMAVGAKAERVFMKLLRTIEKQGRMVNDKGSDSYAPKVFAGMSTAEGVTQVAFKAAMERLLEAGEVKIEWFGPPSRRVSKLVGGGQ